MKTVICENCSRQTTKSTARYNEAIKNGWKFYCSKKCRYDHQVKAKMFLCAWCQKSVRKTPGQIRQTKFNVFCDKSCAAKYNNRHKKSGTRRSKLECYLEEQIKNYFPDVIFSTNTKNPIGLELDFYFPELNLAIEINGYLYFRPIFGIEKLNRIKSLDEEKKLRCSNSNIRLFIINVSNEPHLTKIIKEKHWETVESLLTQQ